MSDVAADLTSDQDAPVKRDAARRALSLDALRGLAILGMVMSGMMPFWNNTLPPWMYHAQLPPPTHIYDATISGLTWVDLVFPLFLFALGAAVPLALSRRLEKSGSRLKTFLPVLFRGGLLLFFALYKQHLDPGALVEQYGNLAWGIGLVAFVVLFAIFSRLPRGWPSWIRFIIRAAGWLAAVALLASVQYADGSGFTVHRHDIIITILANVAVTTALVWLCWPMLYSGRLCIMALLLTMHLAQRYSPWGTYVVELDFLKPLIGDRIYNALIWACAPAYQEYLLITLPGTIAGDILLTWLRPETRRLSFSIQNSRWSELSLGRCLCLAVACLAVVVCVVAGFSVHNWNFPIAASAVAGCVGFALLYGQPGRSRIKNATGLRGQPRVSALLFRSLFTWGVIWLAIGLALLPYQHGIRKDPATLSYMFVSAGLAHMLIIFFAVITDAMHRPGALFLLIDNGQNPMIAYVAAEMVIMPILHLIPVGDGSALDWMMALTPAPWEGFGRGVFLTLLVALLVTAITRLKIFWRT